MIPSHTCPDCGAILPEGQSCQDYFYQILYWEQEDSRVAAVHHLTVLCYHLQHPSLFTNDALRFGRQQLHEFVIEGLSPQAMRQRIGEKVDSGKRTWKVSGTPGSYETPIPWTMTIVDAAGHHIDGSWDRVRAWAQSMHTALSEVYPMG